jgi:hypothetical protein
MASSASTSPVAGLIVVRRAASASLLRLAIIAPDFGFAALPAGMCCAPSASS